MWIRKVDGQGYKFYGIKVCNDIVGDIISNCCSFYIFANFMQIEFVAFLLIYYVYLLSWQVASCKYFHWIFYMPANL